MPSRKALFAVEIGLRAAAHSLQRAMLNPRRATPTDIFLAVADHFEPQVGGATRSVARARLDDWLLRYPKIAARHQDSQGKPPAHTFFYPWDEYDGSEFADIQELCASGNGEIELHLHHRDDTSETLSAKLREAIAAYSAGGALSRWPDTLPDGQPVGALAGTPAWGFVHGNWALDNSRCENGHNFCGVNNELVVLAQHGCYADFTFPAWPQTAQPRQTNSIFYATDDPDKPKSYDRGIAARVGQQGSGDLLLVQGPMVPHLARKGRGWRVAMDDSDLASYRRYSPARLDRWVRNAPFVAGRPERRFIKLHTHGAPDANREALLGEDFDALFSDAEARYNDGQHFRLHYVTTREMFNVIKATEADAHVDLLAARDYVLPSPFAASFVASALSAARPGFALA